MKSSPAAVGQRVVRRIRVRATLFLILALVAGGSAVLLVKQYLQRMKHSAELAQQQTARIVVAKMEIPLATPLTAEHLALVQWPTEHVPSGSFTKMDAVVGRTLRSALAKGEAVLGAKLASRDAGRGLSAILAPGSRAMAVKVDQVVGVAGFVQPGSWVDVLTIMKPDEQTKKQLRADTDKVSKTILQKIKVLAAGEQLVSRGTKPVKVQVVTLQVTPEEAERLALGSRHGELQLTMRSDVDEEQIATEGVTPLALLSPDQQMKRAKAAAQPAAARRRRAPKANKEEPSAPVIEVLRGGRIEERKLRPSADSRSSKTPTLAQTSSTRGSPNAPNSN